jgi:nucleoside 2-deoxyribosyltransferase
MRPLIYLASPLFSRAELQINEALCTVLERWCDVFLPQRDGKLVSELVASGRFPAEAYSEVFKCDIEALERCDAIVVNLDGRSVDEGAAFELGFAFALRKTCVGYRTDVRVLLPWGLNPMLVSPLSSIVSTEIELEAWARDFASALTARARA